MTKRFLLLLGILSGLLALAALNPPPRPVEPQSPRDTRWQKIDARGNALAAWAGPWSCVLDHETGLLWEVKTDDESIHDSYWTYSWFDGHMGEPNRGDCFLSEARCDTGGLIERANAKQTCGRRDWRLPSTTELATLVSDDAQPGEPTLDNAFFPHAQRGDYWTGDSRQRLTGFYRHLGAGAGAISFRDGKPVKLPYRNAAYVRLVTRAR